MKLKLIALVFVCLIAYSSSAQQGTEVYLFDLSFSDGLVGLSNPRNISDNPGYDNQPSFTSDNFLLYTSVNGDQADIVKYDLKSGIKVYLTSTPASEYSPTQTPEKKYFSTITLEQSGRQLLWLYPLDKSGKGEVLVPYLKIGYHTWLDETTLFAFVLGEHMTLQKINLSNQTAEILQEDIGRSLHIVPGTHSLSYVKKNGDDWMIRSYNTQADSTIDLTTTLESVEDFCWYDGTTLLMGKDHLLYQWNDSTDWVQCADLSAWQLSGITRIAISKDRKLLAVVVNE